MGGHPPNPRPCVGALYVCRPISLNASRFILLFLTNILFILFILSQPELEESPLSLSPPPDMERPSGPDPLGIISIGTDPVFSPPLTSEEQNTSWLMTLNGSTLSAESNFWEGNSISTWERNTNPSWRSNSESP